MKSIVFTLLGTALTLQVPGALAAVTSPNLSLDKPASASSEENTNRAATYAVDGDSSTRWASEFADSNWLTIDLEGVFDLSSVVLHWETAYAEQYNLQVSVDGSDWTTVQSVTQSNGGVDSFELDDTARYLRIETVKRATRWGVSLWEVEVYGAEHVAEPEPQPEPEPGPAPVQNVAVGKTLFASSSERSDRSPEQAADGSQTTRWASAHEEGEWIAVDLGSVYNLDEVKLFWEVAYAKAYDVQVSTDANQWHTVHSVTDSDGGDDAIALDAQARYVRIQGVERATRWGISLWELEVYGSEYVMIPDPTLISDGRPALASSEQRDSYSAAQAFDGNDDTRWASVFGDTAWLQVDLGEAHQITEVILDWEAAYSSEYQIQTSYDGQTWTTVEHVLNGQGGTETLAVEGHGRYVRMNALARATGWGHSLWEMQVYGYATQSSGLPGSDSGDGSSGGDNGAGAGDDSDSANPNPSDVTAPTVPGTLSEAGLGSRYVTLNWSASSDNSGVMSYEIYRDGERVTELLAPTTAFTDTDLVPGTTYEYTVRASDAAGNWSGFSTTLVVATASEQVVVDAVRLEWATPDQRENGDYLELDEIGGYEIRYQQVGDAQQEVLVLDDAYATAHEMNLEAGVYEFSIAVFDVNGLYSEFVPISPLR